MHRVYRIIFKDNDGNNKVMVVIADNVDSALEMFRNYADVSDPITIEQLTNYDILLVQSHENHS